MRAASHTYDGRRAIESKPLSKSLGYEVDAPAFYFTGTLSARSTRVTALPGFGHGDRRGLWCMPGCPAGRRQRVSRWRGAVFPHMAIKTVGDIRSPSFSSGVEERFRGHPGGHRGGLLHAVGGELRRPGGTYVPPRFPVFSRCREKCWSASSPWFSAALGQPGMEAGTGPDPP